MAELRQLKTYDDATLSGAPIVVKFKLPPRTQGWT